MNSAKISQNFRMALRSPSIFMTYLANLFALIFCYFSFRETSFTIDDPGVLSTFGNQEFSLYTRIFEPVASRWRPVSSAYFTFAAEVFSGSFLKWWLMAIFLMSLNALLFIKILSNMRVNRWAIFYLSLTLTTSRFAFGFPLNITFAIEILSVTFVFSILLFLQKFEDKNEFIYVSFSIFAFILLILTHERFIFISIYIIATIATWKSISRTKKMFLSLLTLIITIGLMMGKKLLFAIPFLLGTGSTSELGFSINTMLQFSRQFVLGILGLNAGEKYLAGNVWTVQGPVFKALSVILVVITVWLVIKSFAVKTTLGMTSRDAQPTSLGHVLNLPILFVLLSGPAVMTIRLESRWLFLPFAVTLMQISKLFCENSKISLSVSKKGSKQTHKVSRKKRKTKIETKHKVLFGFFAINLIMNSSYRASLDFLYFRWSQVPFEKSIDAVKSANIKALEGDRLVLILDDKSSPEYLQQLTYNIRLRFNDEGIKYVVVDSLLDYKSGLGGAGLLIYGDYILKELDLSKSANRLSFSGDFWPDGWAGKAFTIQIIDPRCLELEIAYLADWKNSVIVTDDLGNTFVDQIGPGSETRLYSLNPLPRSLKFEFSEVRNLNRENGEKRDFSAKIKASCVLS